jgi:hypothetical protein
VPYADRETYLRKQREFYYKRKARADSSQRVNGLVSTAQSNPLKKPEKPPISVASSPVSRPITPVAQPSPTPAPQRASTANPARIGVDLFSFRNQESKPTRSRTNRDVLRASDTPTATRLHVNNLRQSGIKIDALGNSIRIIGPDGN